LDDLGLFLFEDPPRLTIAPKTTNFRHAVKSPLEEFSAAAPRYLQLGNPVSQWRGVLFSLSELKGKNRSLSGLSWFTGKQRKPRGCFKPFRSGVGKPVPPGLEWSDTQRLETN